MSDFRVSFSTMGTGCTLHRRSSPLAAEVVAAVRARFEAIEARFSLYRADSELSRVSRGDLTLARASEELRSAYGEALQWRAATDGDFTPHRPDGGLDLSGLVKAHALRDAARILEETQDGAWLVDVGGDIVCCAPDGMPWRTGIADPGNPAGLLTAVDLGSDWSAIATSGTAERGEHVWRSRQLDDLVQVTVLGGDIVEADVLATAILAGGLPALDGATRTRDIDVLTVDRHGGLRVTPRLRAHVSAHAREGSASTAGNMRAVG